MQETFSAAGSELAYTAYGSGPTVIVLAGGPGLNAAYMAPLARTISSDGCRAVLLDQRGTGRSAAGGANRSRLTERGNVADIEALRIALEQERLRFVTHSFGGAMALAHAAAHSKRGKHAPDRFGRHRSVNSRSLRRDPNDASLC